jgi:hypothetical protein
LLKPPQPPPSPDFDIDVDDVAQTMLGNGKKNTIADDMAQIEQEEKREVLRTRAKKRKYGPAPPGTAEH